jgi:hypothetical protein
MAAVQTFEWFVQQFWPNPDEATKKAIQRHRDYLLKLRSENERLRYVEELMHEAQEMKKRKAS